MSNGASIIIVKEWKSFLGSEKVIFAVYGALVLLWSFLFVSTRAGASADIYTVWLLSFAILVASNFSQGVFVSERVSGSLEILLTSGISRGAILFGKSAFVFVMSVTAGISCMGLSWVWGLYWPVMEPGADLGPDPSGIALFTAASFMSTASSAWLSVRLGNPRALPFVNLIGTIGVIGLYFLIKAVLPFPLWGLAAAVTLLGVILMASAWRGFHGEKIIQPVNL